MMKKRIITVLLALILTATLIPCALADDVTLNDPAEVLNFGLRSHGPMSIAKGQLHRGDRVDEVYLVSLAGAASLVWEQNSISAFVCSALSVPPQYFFYAKNVIMENVPKGSNLLFIGHSAGGAVAQQLAADVKLTKNYNIINVVACGSPEIIVFGREGTLHRLCDILDPIPMLSLATVVNTFLEISYQVGDYSKFPELPHAKSYYKTNVWGDFDCLGVRGGSAYLTCNHADCKSFSLDRLA